MGEKIGEIAADLRKRAEAACGLGEERSTNCAAVGKLLLAYAERIEASYATSREAMNALFKAGVAMRDAQRVYFRERTIKALETSKQAESRFDAAIEICRNIGKPKQMTLGGFEGGAK